MSGLSGIILAGLALHLEDRAALPTEGTEPSPGHRARPAHLLSLAAVFPAAQINQALSYRAGGHQCRGEVTAGRTEAYSAV